MLNVTVPEDSVYYDRSRRRVVPFTGALRDAVVGAAEAVRELYDRDTLPEPVADERCRACLLIGACTPFELRQPTLPDPFDVQGAAVHSAKGAP